MAKERIYDYVILPNDKGFTLDNPFSATRVTTLHQAYKWAETLIRFNPTCARVLFKANKGRTTYYLENEGAN
jgi:hypothetical protein